MTGASAAFVIPRLPCGTSVGGAETLLRSLAERATLSGRRVTVLTTCALDHFTWRNEVPPGRRRAGPLDVIYFPVDADRDTGRFHTLQTRISRGRPLSEGEEAEWLRHSVNSRALCEHLRRHTADYDRILTGPYLFGLTHAAAEIIPERTFLVPCLHDEPFARLGVVGDLFRRVRGALYNSLPEQNLAVRLYGLGPGHGRVVGMGFAPFSASPDAFRTARGLGPVPYVLYCGRREPMKGTPLLIEYLALFRQRTGRDFRVILTGSGPFDTPPALAGRLLDLGVVSEEEKRDVMADATVFCHPSVNESFGIVLMESWLAGTPALVHAASEVLRFHCARGGGGLWFGDYPEFEASLTLLLDRAPLRRALGTAGKTYVMNEYTWDAVERRLFDALDNA